MCMLESTQHVIYLYSSGTLLSLMSSGQQYNIFVVFSYLFIVFLRSRTNSEFMFGKMSHINRRSNRGIFLSIPGCSRESNDTLEAVTDCFCLYLPPLCMGRILCFLTRA